MAITNPWTQCQKISSAIMAKIRNIEVFGENIEDLMLPFELAQDNNTDNIRHVFFGYKDYELNLPCALVIYMRDEILDMATNTQEHNFYFNIITLFEGNDPEQRLKDCHYNAGEIYRLLLADRGLDQTCNDHRIESITQVDDDNNGTVARVDQVLIAKYRTTCS